MNPKKREDTAHASGDIGEMILAVRKDAAAALAGTDGDYAPLEVDSAGRLWTHDPIVASAVALLSMQGVSALATEVTLQSALSVLSNLKTRADLLGTETAFQSAIALLSSHGGGALATETALQSAISILSNSKTRLDLIGSETAFQSAIALLSSHGTGALGTEVTLQSAISLLSNIETRADLLGTEVALQSAVAILSSHGMGALGTETSLQSAISILSNSKTRLDLLGTETALQSAISLLSNLKTRADLLGTQATLSNVAISIDNIETNAATLAGSITGTAQRAIGLEGNAGASLTIAAAAYAAGDCVGGATTVASLARTSGVGGVLKGVQVTIGRAITPAIDVYVRAGSFDKAPADNASMSAGAAASFSSTDWPLLRGPIRIAATDWRPAGAGEHAYGETAMSLPASDSGTAYQVVVKAVDAIASAAAATLRVDFDLMRD